MSKLKEMKSYILINGDYTCTFRAKNRELAMINAVNSSDHSKEIIVREIKVLDDFAGIIEPIKDNPLSY